MHPLFIFTFPHIGSTISKSAIIVTYFLKTSFPRLLCCHRDGQIIYLLDTHLLGNSVFFYKLLICINQCPVFRYGKNAVTHFIEYTLENLQLPLRGHPLRYITTHNQYILFIQRKDTIFVMMMFTIKIQFMMGG